MKKKDLVDQLVSEIETGKVRTLGIYGHGASGKSTFAQELYQALDSAKVNLLETDPYIASNRHLVVPKETPDKLELLSLIDILVDGRYDRTKRNLMLQFRGSSNQRIIDVQKSLQSGQVVIWDKLNDGKESYEQVKR